MRLERLPEYLTTAVVTLVGMGIAMYCGRLTGQGQTSMVALILCSALGLAVCLQMRGQIWVAIPIAWALTGRVSLLPLPFAVRDLAVLVVCAVFFALVAMKVIRRKPTYDKIDLLFFLCLALLAASFVRNPVGTYAMGSARIGGKPYFDVFIGGLAYLVLCRATLLPRWASILPIFFTLGYVGQTLLNVIAVKFPWTTPYIAMVYSGIVVEVEDNSALGAVGNGLEEREAYLAGLGESIALALCSYFRPLTLISPVHWLRAGVFFLACFCALKSGHRLAVIDIGVFFLLSSYFRRGIREVLQLCAAGIPLLGILLLLQGTFIELPLPAQRALSFLPGRWNTIATSDADSSVEWRVQMWKLALQTDRYIKNKVFGDGFGYSLQEYEAMLNASIVNFAAASQENALRQGAFHSGPLSAIRTVGVVGLGVFLILLIAMAVRAARLIRRSEGTPYYIFALFVCIPVIHEPFKYVFIFGSFEGGLPYALFMAGLLKLLSHSLTEYEANEAALSNRSQSVKLRPQRPSIPVRTPLPARFRRASLPYAR